MKENPPTLLLIEDSPEDRESIRHALGDDYRIIEADSGERGLALATDARPDCVLLDDFLPDMDGLEFLAARGPGYDDDYPVLILTGSEEPSLAVACLKQGAHDVLIKGRFSADGLRRAVHHAIENVGLKRQIALQQRDLERTIVALQASEARLQLMIEHAPAALAMLDREMRYLAVSNRWLADYGLGRSELIGRSHYEIFPEINQHLREVHQRALAGETVRGAEDRFERLDGSVQWLHWEIYPWHDAEGRVAGVGLFSEDITARQQAETALRESEDRLRMALDASQMGVYDWDIATNRVVWSHHHERLWGFAPGEFDGTYAAFASRVHPDDLARVADYLDHCLTARTPLQQEYRVVWPDGSLHWIAGFGEFIDDAAGQPVRMRGVVMEITARKAAEQQMARDLDAMTRLQNLGMLCAQEDNLASMLTEILDAAIAIADADCGGIQRLDPASGDLRIAAQRGFSPEWVDFYSLVAIGHGCCGTVLERGERVIVEDVEQSPLFVGTPALDVQRRAGVRAVQSTPLVTRAGTLVGIVSTHWRAPHLPDDWALRLLDLLSRQAADIIERSLARQALQESEARLRLALDAARLGPFDWEIMTNRVIWSRQHEVLFGLAPGELDGTFEAFARRIHPEDWPGIEAEVARCVAAREPMDCEYRVIWPDGSLHWIAARGEFVFDATGQPLRVRGVDMEITPRKQAEEALRQSEERLRLLGDNLPDSALYQYTHEPDGSVRFLYVSAGIERLNGVQVAAVLADAGALHRQIPPEYFERLVAAEALSERALSDFDMEIPMRRADGETRWMHLHSRPRRLPDGRTLWDGVQTDITERKAAERALRRYRQIVETSGEMLCFIDREQRFQLVNPAFAAFYGGNPQALQGRSVRALVGEALYARIGPELEATLQGEPRRFPVQTTCPDGLIRSLESTHTPFEVDGKVQGVVVVLHDVTDAQLAQAALEAERASLEERVAARTAELQAAEAKLRTLFDLLPVGISITDPRGHLIDGNRAAETLIGLARDAHLARDVDGPEWAILRPDGTPMPAGEYAAVRALTERRPIRDIEMGVVLPAGGVRWILASAMPSPRPDEGVIIVYVDISERKRAEQALRRESEKNSAFLRGASDGVHILDTHGNVIEISDSFCAMLGYTREELIGMNVAQWDAGFTADEIERIGRNLFEKPARTVFETRHRRKDGEIFDVEVSSYPIHLEGRLLMFSSTRDISARKQAEVARDAIEQALRIERQRLENVIDGTLAGTWEWDVQTGAVTFNERWAAIIGYRLDELEPLSIQTWLDLSHPDDLKTSTERLEAHVAGGAPFYECELRMRHKAGHWVWIADRGKVMVWDADGHPRRMAGTHQDITERKVAEIALRASEAHAQAVIDSSPVPLAIASETSPIRYLNAAFVETFGYTPEDIPTLTDWRRLAFPDSIEQERIIRLRQERLSMVEREGGGSIEPLEIEVHCKDGRVRTVMARATPLPSGERLNTLYDITDLKAAREQAERSARAKSDFLAHMSHEIRTPMNGILGLAEVALHKSLSPEVREDLTQIQRSGAALLGILNNILDYARIESGRLTLEQAPLDLSALLATLRGFFGQAAASKGLAFSLEVEPGVPHHLLGDALRLQQVLANLLGNAIKFTDRGAVRLRVSDLTPGAAPAQLRWSVTDTGIGMDAAVQAQLFEPFRQGDDSIARRFGGTGLGLSISRDLVAFMGGRLEVTSAPGQGSTFCFDLRLPLAPDLPTTATPPVPARAPPAGARILVAEDQPINQRVIGDMLRLLGLSFTLANDGQAALASLAQARYDAVLMDIQMPGMDGLTATRAIRANPAWTDLPVIALTAGVTAAERARIDAAGLDDLLPKPLTLDALRATLGRWLADGVGLDEPSSHTRVPVEPEAAPTLPGFDLSRLRQIVAGEEAVGDLLRQFADAVLGDADAIAAALDSGDLTAAGQVAHRLKGLAGTVGANALQDMAEQLEAALGMESSRAAEALARLRLTHTQALEQIARLPATVLAEPASVEGHPEDTVRLLSEIRAFLEQRRFVAPAVRAALRTALPASAQPSYQALIACLDRLDYPGAERHLAALDGAKSAPGESND